MSSNLEEPKVVSKKIYKREESKYKYVYMVRRTGRLMWQGKIKNGYGKTFETDEAAARWVDLELIKQGLEPINILKSIKKQSA